MAISFNCACGERLEVDDELAGQRARCPYCEAVVDVPAAPTPPTAKRAKLAAELDDDRPPRRRAEDDEDRPSRRRADDEDDGDEGVTPRRRRRRFEPPPYNLFNNQTIAGSIAIVLSVTIMGIALFFDVCWYGLLFFTVAGFIALVRGVVSGRNG